jgi:hypothetical protein
MLDYWEYKTESTGGYWAVDENSRRKAQYAVTPAEDTEYRAVFVSTQDRLEFAGGEAGIHAAGDTFYYKLAPNQYGGTNNDAHAGPAPAMGHTALYKDYVAAPAIHDAYRIHDKYSDSAPEARGSNAAAVIAGGLNALATSNVPTSEAVDAYDNAVLWFPLRYWHAIEDVKFRLFVGEDTGGELLHEQILDMPVPYQNQGTLLVYMDAMPPIDAGKVTLEVTVPGHDPMVMPCTLGAGINDIGYLPERAAAAAEIQAVYGEYMLARFSGSTGQYSSECWMMKKEYADGLEAVKDATTAEGITEAKDRTLLYMQDALNSVFHSGVEVGVPAFDFHVVTVPAEVDAITVLFAALEQAWPGQWYYSLGASQFGFYFNHAGHVNEVPGPAGVRIDGGPVVGGYGIMDATGTAFFANGVSNQRVWEGLIVGLGGGWKSGTGIAAVKYVNFPGSMQWDLARLRMRYSDKALQSFTVDKDGALNGSAAYQAALALQYGLIWSGSVPNLLPDDPDVIAAFKALRLDPEFFDFLNDRETEATRDVIKLIAALTDQSAGSEVSAAKNAYQALSAEEKSGVFNYDDLAAAVAQHASADEAAAFQVVTLIGQIGDAAYTEASSAKIGAAQSAYDGASDGAKALVGNVNVLETAKNTFNALREEKVQAAADAIDSLGNSITLGDEAAVKAAQDAFDALLAADKAAFASDNAGLYAKLQDSVATLTDLKNAAALAALDEAREDALAYVKDRVSEPAFGDEWAVLALARGGDNDSEYFSDYYDSIVNYLKGKGSARLDDDKSTENSRLILALSSIGKDAADVGGFDLTAPYADFDWVKFQGINGPIFALLALDSRLYPVPETGSFAALTTLDSLIKYILGDQLTDGGWNFNGDGTGSADPDVTGMALQALAPYRSNPDVEAAIGRALAALSAMQRDDGGFGSAEGISQAITALSALGIDAAEDERFQKTGGNPLTALLSYRDEDSGGFKFLGELNDMTTEQAAYALVAYDRFVKGENSLYDMTDVAGIEIPPALGVRLQGAALTEGAAGTASFTVTRTNLPDGTYTASLTGAPDGVTVVTGNVIITGGSGTLTLETTTATPAGSHTVRLRLTADGVDVTSGAFTLEVAWAGGNTGDGGNNNNNNGSGGDDPGDNNNNNGTDSDDTDTNTETGTDTETGTGTETGAGTETGTGITTADGVSVSGTAPFTPADSDVQIAEDVKTFKANDISEIADLPGLAGLPSDVIGLLTFDASLDGNGVLVADAGSVVSGLSAADAAAIDTSGKIIPLPVFQADTAPGKTPLVAMRTRLDGFAGEKIGSVALLKLKSDGTTERLGLAASPRGISHAQYAWTDGSGNAVSPETVITAGSTYVLSIAIKDGSAGYDWDPTPGSVVDPTALAHVRAANGTDSSGGSSESAASDGSSGGCDSGAGVLPALGILALALVIERRKAA